MKKRITIIVIVTVVIATAGIGVTAYLIRGGAVRALNATELSVGEKYLAELNYTKAIATFQNVINVEPNNTEAYLALSKAYRYMGDLDMVRKNLENGLEQTNSTTIERELYELLYVNTTASGGQTTPDVASVEIAGQSYCVDITELVLRDCGLKNTDMQKLSYFTNLERLDISGNGISDISAVANLKNLKKFYAANNSITDVSALAGIGSLEYIGLRGNKIVNADVLLTMSSLLYLHLSDNQITTLQSVGSNLQLLYVANNKINDLTAMKNANLLYSDISGNSGM